MTDAEREVRAAMEITGPLRAIDKEGLYDLVNEDMEPVACYLEREDAERLVALVNHVPALLGEVERLRGVEAAARRCLSAWRNDSPRGINEAEAALDAALRECAAKEGSDG